MKLGQHATLTPTWGVVRLTKHKYFEYQFESRRFNSEPFELSAKWTSRRDHAGFDFIFSIYKLFWIMFTVYDNRHWDFETETWKTPEACTFGESTQHIPDYLVESDDDVDSE